MIYELLPTLLLATSGGVSPTALIISQLTPPYNEDLDDFINDTGNLAYERDEVADLLYDPDIAGRVGWCMGTLSSTSQTVPLGIPVISAILGADGTKAITGTTLSLPPDWVPAVAYQQALTSSGMLFPAQSTAGYTLTHDYTCAVWNTPASAWRAWYAVATLQKLLSACEAALRPYLGQGVPLLSEVSGRIQRVANQCSAIKSLDIDLSYTRETETLDVTLGMTLYGEIALTVAVQF